MMTLKVGCTLADVTSWIDADNTGKTVKISSPTSNALTFNPPTLTNTNPLCKIGTHSVINVVNSIPTPSNIGI